MRNLPSNIVNGVQKRIQAKSTNSDLSAVMWISRPTVSLTEDRFLEKQEVSSGNFDSVSVAVNRPSKYKGSSAIYMAVIKDGVAKVLSANYKDKMNNHVWVDTGFSEWAEDVSIAFDGTMPKDATGKVQFVTNGSPWVFWVLNGALYTKNLYTDEVIALAERNCTRVSAVRAMWSGVGDFDFGLIVFFILNGVIYYRQLIDGEWTDAEIVTFGPSGVTWVDIAAQRTWDYRVAVQAMSSDGTIYELFTQYMGIGKQTVEHIEIRDINANGELTGIRYTDTKSYEHIEIAAIDAGALYGGLYATGQPSFLSAQNVPVDAVDEEGTAYQDWGKVVLAALDVHLEPASVASNAAQFTLTDSKGKTFVAAAAEPINANGLTLRLTFADFNAASGACTLTYTPGTVATMYGLTVEAMSVEFTPENLIAPTVSEPKAVEAYSVDAEGTQIAVVFSEEITDGITADGWTVTMPEYDMVPGGTLSTVTRTVTAAAVGGDANVVLLSFAAGNQTSVQNAAGPITVAYNGATMAGLGGFVQAFELECLIDGLAYKGGQNDMEHIEISGITATGVLKKIEYRDAKSGDEHIEISAITATGTLTHVDDI